MGDAAGAFDELIATSGERNAEHKAPVHFLDRSLEGCEVFVHGGEPKAISRKN
jgi:hypothetical protein